MTNRKQIVSTSGFTSSIKPVLCDVPQGPTLDLLLFLIYINDLKNAFEKSIIHQFADATSLLYASKNLANKESSMNIQLKRLIDWFRAERVLLNESKANLIIFHPKRITVVKTCS